MNNIILTGFSGTGKSTVGQRIAILLAKEFIDTDKLISTKAGKTIHRIFEEDGEDYFRKLESLLIKEVCSKNESVIAIGGGAFSNPTNREMLLGSGVVISLDAEPETILNRLSTQSKQPSKGANRRPMISNTDPLQNITDLKAQRKSEYQLAHSTIMTDEFTINEIAAKAIKLWDKQTFNTKVNGLRGWVPEKSDKLSSLVYTAEGPYPVFVGWGILEELGLKCIALGSAKKAFLFSDSTVFPQHGETARFSLERAGLNTEVFTIPAGEQSKSLSTAAKCYEWLASHRAERGDLIIALGGGVVGDLTGFVAATFNRGMRFIQVPTSLAAMVDASIGGKTAVNLIQGKNLVGTFYQPKFVFADVKTLLTLPQRELCSGWAEAIKHGLILDQDLLKTFESYSKEIVGLEGTTSVDVIRRSIAIKADIVSQDEKETLGIRTLLNYGHTVGHGLENATEYGTLLHGEAVSIGMGVAVRISEKMGLISKELVARQDEILLSFGLPIQYQISNYAQIREAMSVDKKSSKGKITWVLLEGVGKAILRSDVPDDTLNDALNEVLVS